MTIGGGGGAGGAGFNPSPGMESAQMYHYKVLSMWWWVLVCDLDKKVGNTH
jgi:hypothetical protein